MNPRDRQFWDRYDAASKVGEETRLAIRALTRIRALGRRHSVAGPGDSGHFAEVVKLAEEALAAIEAAADRRVSRE
jgi:hypothetical protein